jgi:hypothetical protein
MIELGSKMVESVLLPEWCLAKEGKSEWLHGVASTGPYSSGCGKAIMST